MKKLKDSLILKITLIIVFVLVLFSSINFEDFSTEDTIAKVENIISSTPLPGNKIYNGYIVNVPEGVKVEEKDETILLENGKALYSIYFGIDTKVDRVFLSGINEGQERLINVSSEDNNEVKYFYMWDYENDSIGDYVSVLIGRNDIFVEGVFPKKDMEKYSVEIAQIFNSIKKIERGEEW